MNLKNITPDHVELVRYDALSEGDVLVAFTAIGRDIDVPPTARQLRMARTRWTRVNTIDNATTPAGIPVLEINLHEGDDRRATALPTTLTWRIRPSALALLEV